MAPLGKPKRRIRVEPLPEPRQEPSELPLEPKKAPPRRRRREEAPAR